MQKCVILAAVHTFFLSCTGAGVFIKLHPQVPRDSLLSLSMSNNESLPAPPESGRDGVYERSEKLLYVGDKVSKTPPSIFSYRRTQAPRSCAEYHKCNSTTKCEFIKKHCKNEDGFISYLQIIYCTFPEFRIFGFIILAFWLLYLLIGLGVTAEEFFCPDLDVMAHTLKMSQNIAGVTLLAFGNGAPDIFSAMAAVTNSQNGEAGLAIGALFGAGIFVTTVVAGSISIVRPFKMVERPFLRDSIFYLGAAFWTFYILYKGSIMLYEAIGYLVLYVLYVVVVFVGHKVYQHRKLKRQARVEAEENIEECVNGTLPNNLPYDLGPAEHLLDDPCTSPLHFSRTSINSTHIAPADRSHGTSPPVDFSIDPVTMGQWRGDLSPTKALAVASLLGSAARNITPHPHTNDGDDTCLLADGDEECAMDQLKKFLVGLCPINLKTWSEKRWYTKVLEIIKSPLMFFLIATIPVVDYAEPRHNWNRLLNIFNLLTAPMFCAFVTKGLTVTIHGSFQVWHIMLALSIFLAVLVFFTSKPNKQPVYHGGFAYIGFVVAVLWIYSTANEIVNILQMFGTEFNVDDAILGLTVLAWGNSVGDLVSDITMARQGFPTMGMSACFGGPMFNMLMGIGISCTITTIRDGGTFVLSTNNVQLILALGLATSLLSSMFIMLFNGFRPNKWYGLYLYVVYLVFLTLALLTALEVVKW